MTHVTAGISFRRLADALPPAFEAVEAFFTLPSKDRAESALKQLRAIEDLQAPQGATRAALSLFRMAQAAAQAVAEADRWALPADANLQDLARAARLAAEELAKASSARKAAEASASVIRAKKRAARLEDLKRRATQESLRAPAAVRGMAVRTIHRRLSDAALFADDAAEAIGDLLY